MTIMQTILTPGQPLYWFMILLPNVTILLFALFRSLKRKAFLFIAAAALLNIAIPYGAIAINNRSNGLNAPGTPEWMMWSFFAMYVNQGTLVLLLALTAIAWKFKTPTREEETELSNPTPDGIRRPADGSPKPSV